MKDQTEINNLIDRLFREESGKLIAVLTRLFGAENLDLAEDVVQDALTEALRSWTDNGIPENPGGWLYRVAKNKALNILRREQVRQESSSDVAHFLQSTWTAQPALEHLFSEKEIQDDQLRMIFTCCHSAISVDSQIALALKTLCGFSTSEIASAFITTEENVHKRLVRARKTIRDQQIPFDVPVGAELETRLRAVQETIYLLFNEGYKASRGDSLVRLDLAEEAIRLAEMVVEHPSISAKQTTYALLALMQLNASRFSARLDQDGNLMTLEHQDRSLWDQDRIKAGFVSLQKSDPHQFVSKYHILAIISSYHCAATDFEKTNWMGILHEYDRLLQIDDSSIVRLNRTIVLSRVEGLDVALSELEKIKGLDHYQLYHSVKADFEIRRGEHVRALSSLQKAYTLTSVPSERALINERMSHCKKKIEN
ncbi:MAG: sigma-70 family RNA polymerase sigma factor [Cyclobacteriaceae bacterium]